MLYDIEDVRNKLHWFQAMCE